MDWVEKQVAFWYGSSYDYALLSEWEFLREMLDASDFGRSVNSYLSIDDITIESISRKFGGFASYRYERALDVVKDIIEHDVYRRLDRNNILPILMVDSIGYRLPTISYNRIVSHQNAFALLWPVDYHLQSSLVGLSDAVPFKAKRDGLVYRGSLSGPIKSLDLEEGLRKTSRFEVVRSVSDLYPSANVAISGVPSDVESDDDFQDAKSEIVKYLKSPISMQDMFKSKFILCIEGADIGTGFGSILASNSVPVHPYPFCFNTWYFSGLRPWEHFVPLRPDASNIVNIMDYCQSNPVLMENIARNGRQHMVDMLDNAKLSLVKKRAIELWNMR